MKYLRTDILDGSIKSDQTLLDALLKELLTAQEELDLLYRQAKTDWRTFLKNVKDCPEDWAPTHKNLKTLIGLTKGVYSDPLLGMNEEEVIRLKKQITTLRDKIEAFKPSEMTTFLSAIPDEYVTDAGLTTAGIKHQGLGRYLVLAKEG